MAGKSKRRNLSGLMVDYSQDGPVIRVKGTRGTLYSERAPPGWYVYVQDWVGGDHVEWTAVLVATFRRKIDADLASISLTAAGLNTAKALKRVTFEDARIIALRDLQW